MKLFFTTLVFTLISLSITSQTFDVDTIQYKGDVNYLINIVILGDGYLESELEKFKIDAQNMSNAFINETPFSNYQNYFNVFLIKVPSNESGAALHPDSLIDNYFGSTYWFADIERLLVPTNSTNIMNVLASNFPYYDQVFMIVNSSKYGGSGGWVATTSTHSSANEIAFHELGHSFSYLADEYWAGTQYANEAINMTQETNISDLKWKNWYGDFGIGLYPHSESPTWYRPHQNCKMRYLGVPYCSVCLEGIVERIHTLASPLISYFPDYSDITIPSLPLTCKLDLINPIPNTLKRTWEINGLPFENNVDSVLINESNLLEGSNTLTVTVEDTCDLLRIDNHSTIHLSIINWNIDNTSTGVVNITSSSNDIIINLYPNPLKEYLNVKFQGVKEGTLKVEIIDLQGKIQTSELLNPTELNSLILDNLSQGIYIARFYIDNDFITSRKIMITR
jgi:hypothetical protein